MSMFSEIVVKSAEFRCVTHK